MTRSAAQIRKRFGMPDQATEERMVRAFRAALRPARRPEENGSAWLLQKVTQTGVNLSTTFQYGQTSGEMTQMTTPLGGSLTWDYRTYTYSGGRSYREVATRQLTGSTNTSPWSWSIALDSNPNLHAAATVADAGAGTQKVWTFGATGLTASYEERDTTNAALLHNDYTWSADATGRPYVGTVLTTQNPGTAYAAQSKTTQTLDTHGNLTQSEVYDYGNLTTPARTYNYTYLADANYTSRYIYNRLLEASLTAGGTTSVLQSNSYDYVYTGFNEPNAPLHDDTNYGANFPYRGNRNVSLSPAGLTTTWYTTTGRLASTTSPQGVTTSTSSDASTGYSLPAVITPGGNSNLATTVAYNSSWAVTSVTGANGANSTITYDSYGRPQSSKVPDGAVTNYTYTYLPNTQTATLGSRWTRTTLDGFGRTTKVETGHDSTTVSVAETEYAPCACSPLGKLWRTSRPHAPGASPQWTTYTYDGCGRTLTVTLPDGSATHSEYTGNTTKVTDAAGKWKKQTTDAMGHLTVVTEPSPSGGADWTTTYGYNVLDKLVSVAMPRPYGGGTYTQTRSFTYPTLGEFVNGIWKTVPSAYLASETNPETGTITYQYDGNRRLASKTDARGHQTQYTYDGYGRVTQTRYYTDAGVTEDRSARIDYHYDTNPLDGSYTQNGWGRLASVEFSGRSQGGWFADYQLQYHYSYNQAGRVTNQRMRVYADARYSSTPRDIDAAYGWDTEGRMTSLTGPDNGPVDSYTYDAMGRLASGGATYGPAGELLTFNGVTRTYNALGQVTRMTKAGVMDVEYRYTGGQNNGRIWQSKDYVTGEEVTYTYDALNRLSAAQTTDAAWGQAYGYDGWGNLLSKSVTKGTGPVLNLSFDPSLNMPVGSPPPSQDTGADGEGRQIAGAAEFTADPNNGGAMMSGRVSWDPSGKKVVWVGWTSPQIDSTSGYCEIYFHAITGQRLARYRCRYGDDPYSWSMYLQDRTQHIGGQLTSWNGTAVTTDRLGSVRNGASFYPYGESRTGSGAVYAGLESPVRKYDATTGGFDRPDPLGAGAAVLDDPGSWNRLAYTQGDPVNFVDPDGLQKCGDLPIVGGVFDGQTVSQVMTGTTGLDMMAQLIFHEGGTIYQSDLKNSLAYELDLIGIGTAILNQWDVDNGRIRVHDSDGNAVYPIDGKMGYRSLKDIILAIAKDKDGAIFNSAGKIRKEGADKIAGILATDVSAAPLVLDSSGAWINIGCEGILASITVTNGLYSGSMNDRYKPDGLMLLYWNLASPTSTSTFPGSEGYIGVEKIRIQGETFWALPGAPVPPARGRRRPV